MRLKYIACDGYASIPYTHLYTTFRGLLHENTKNQEQKQESSERVRQVSVRGMRTKEREGETKDLKLKHEDDNQEQNTTEKTSSKPREFVGTLLTAQEMKILNDLILYSMVALCRRGANARSEKVL